MSFLFSEVPVIVIGVTVSHQLLIWRSLHQLQMKEFHKSSFFVNFCLIIINFFIYHELFLTPVIVLLSSDILKVKVHSYRDGSSKHHDYMDMAECTFGIKAPSPSPANSSDKQVVPQSTTTPPREHTRYVF